MEWKIENPDYQKNNSYCQASEHNNHSKELGKLQQKLWGEEF